MGVGVSETTGYDDMYVYEVPYPSVRTSPGPGDAVGSAVGQRRDGDSTSSFGTWETDSGGGAQTRRWSKRIVLHSEKQGQRERCKGTRSGLWESWGLREERRKFGERTDRFLDKYDVDFKSSANLGPTASNPKAQKTVCRGLVGRWLPHTVNEAGKNVVVGYKSSAAHTYICKCNQARHAMELGQHRNFEMDGWMLTRGHATDRSNQKVQAPDGDDGWVEVSKAYAARYDAPASANHAYFLTHLGTVTRVSNVTIMENKVYRSITGR
ncbi:unnamed protein product [Fusarium venenatum]|uniref:Uncharacterized protein n=1 Tax=Fusarium venenatum TaxID=56646 RepID=A0A2L2TY36_9HYPO|nr:uncharacterized protein FVRRES_03472 [Fusarium venenatum]CEI66960.1 unnamed protein product [Fusarium venenatum]